MITDDGAAKIIDFGFGKRISNEDCFDKSISLNWWCTTPDEFKEGVYDFKTEIYFVGMLFQKIISEKNIEGFNYKNLLNKMSIMETENRVASFFEINKIILNEKFLAIDFDLEEIMTYREFSASLYLSINHIRSDSGYHESMGKIQSQLEDTYKKIMLEEYAPNNSPIINCFIDGSYSQNSSSHMSVNLLKEFLDLIKSCSRDKKNIILSNLHSSLDTVSRSEPEPNFDDDIPF